MRESKPPKPATPQGPQAKALRALGERYIESTMERFPSIGSALGRHEFDGDLEVPSEKLIHAQQKLVHSTLAEVEAIARAQVNEAADPHLGECQLAADRDIANASVHGPADALRALRGRSDASERHVMPEFV